MKNEQFLWWLRGFLDGKDSLSKRETEFISGLLNEQLGIIDGLRPSYEIILTPNKKLSEKDIEFFKMLFKKYGG